MSSNNKDIFGSIVLYNNNREILLEAINSYLNTSLGIHLMLIDNSPTDSLKNIIHDPRVTYLKMEQNVGFGKGHNIAIRKAIEENYLYHLVLNPDVYFEGGTLERLFSFMQKNADVGQVMPKVLYPDGSIQFLCKLLPTPFDLFLRRYIKVESLQNLWNEKYELRFTNYDKEMIIPYLSGCFMFLRIGTLKEVGLFDEKIFMYLEDTDLTRRIYSKYKTVFFPEATIYHHFAKGSHKSIKLMLISIESSIKYFFKWGWFFDRQRRKINKQVLMDLGYYNKN